MENREKLFDKFPEITTMEWLDNICLELKGDEYREKLVWKTDEGFEVNPFYREEDIRNLDYIDSLPGQYPYLRGSKINNNKWYIRQNIEVSDFSSANRKARDILRKGVDSLGFIITDPDSVNDINLAKLLDGVRMEDAEINFHCHGKAMEILDFIIKISDENRLDANNLSWIIETDPVGRLMISGKLCVPVESGFDYLASLTDKSSELKNLRTIDLKASHFNSAGGDITMELAYALSMGSEYLAQLTDRGVKAGLAASRMRFTFGVGPEYFKEIARLRAARLLWSAVVKGFQPTDNENIRMNIHCVTGRWNKTIYDPYVNMLRTQTEAMSAILGGTDSLTVEPYDINFRYPDEFSERIARNQQLLLKEEAYFDKVADPSGGSYYIENLTSLIAESSWRRFCDIEDNGGFLNCLKSGLIQSNLSEAAGRRRNNIATRKSVLLGTNLFPDMEEKINDSVKIVTQSGNKAVSEDLPVEPIKSFRGSEEYDKIRGAVDRAKKQPVVFILPIGDSSVGKIRSLFSKNFFGCAGYRVLDNDGFNSVEEGVKSFIASKADIVVICSSDDEYLRLSPVIYSKLKETAVVVIAGNPEPGDIVRPSGADLFISLNSDLPEILGRLNKRLGINS